DANTFQQRRGHLGLNTVGSRCACGGAPVVRPDAASVPYPRTGEPDLPQDVVEIEDLRIDRRFAAREQRRRDVALWIGPAEDVGEPYVPEGIWRVGPVHAEPTVARHEPHAVAERQPEREVDLEIRLLDEGAADRARLEDPRRRRGVRRRAGAGRSGRTRPPSRRRWQTG